APYTAAAPASLRNDIWSTSLASKASKAALSRTIPSITKRGSAKLPRKRIFELAPANPEVPVTLTPAARPANALERFDGATFFNASPLTVEIAEVILDLFWVPYPTTTTSSILALS